MTAPRDASPTNSGEPEPNKQTSSAAAALLEELSDRDREILRHVARYKLSTIAMLHRLFCPQSQENAAAKIATRLSRSRWLRAYPLYERYKYLALTSKAVSALGAPRRSSGALGGQALTNAYGCLCYCVESGATKLTDQEFRLAFPNLDLPGLACENYCLETAPNSSALRLTLIKVDHGAAATRVVSRLKRGIVKRYGSPGFRGYIDAERFAVVVLAATAGKRDQIEQEIRTALGSLLPCRVVAVAELAQLLLAKRYSLSADSDSSSAL